ncbi:bacillithiol biosynthesis deacetylase BshB1 [Paenibacillus thermotolerans]|uniref:bacillithiol biosynthesis deacetylase BshB1 n=1 Tax=Paenibacillus thermotolerans TaxID=3027807 RepID=UPI002368086E|nr:MULTISPECIES: bacillithiol biosynthesis deacetylase BshB1 [unclassified Paenibacillus]
MIGGGQSSNGLDILAFGAHPDDVEIGMAGTIAKHTAAGYRVGICDLTQAEMSSNGDVITRKKEAENAAAVLGLSYRSCLELPDRGLRMTDEYLEKIVREIRACRPRLVFIPYWQDRHPDHVACSAIMQEAIFNAKLRKYASDASAWTVERTYFYFINDVVDSELAVDVSDVYELKRRALMSYRSQFEIGEGAVATPLNQGYVERVEQRDGLLGGKLGVRFAEGFVTKIPYAVKLF